MIILISPSKSIMKQSPPAGLKLSERLFPEKTDKLVNKLQALNTKQLANLLSISPELADINHSRFQNWDETEKRPALWMYSGDVYNGIDAYSLNNKQIDYAQEKLRIISGLYGLVRPLDAIQPYRLEMKTNTKKLVSKDLYEYWKEEIATKLQLLKDEYVLICASKEYSEAVLAGLPEDITAITPRFMQETSDGLKEKGLFAKFGRGLLARYAIDNEISKPDELKKFNKDGFTYSVELSSPTEMVYIIPKGFTLKGRFTKK